MDIAHSINTQVFKYTQNVLIEIFWYGQSEIYCLDIYRRKIHLIQSLRPTVTCLLRMAKPGAWCAIATGDVIESQLRFPDQWMVSAPPMGGDTDLIIDQDFWVRWLILITSGMTHRNWA